MGVFNVGTGGNRMDEWSTLDYAIEVASQEAYNSAATPGQMTLADGWGRHLRENFDIAMERKVELADLTQEQVDEDEWLAFSFIVYEAQEVFWNIMYGNPDSMEEALALARETGTDDI